jgi:hypothetical protein
LVRGCGSSPYWAGTRTHVQVGSHVCCFNELLYRTGVYLFIQIYCNCTSLFW